MVSKLEEQARPEPRFVKLVVVVRGQCGLVVVANWQAPQQQMLGLLGFRSGRPVFQMSAHCCWSFVSSKDSASGLQKTALLHGRHAVSKHIAQMLISPANGVVC